MHHHYDDIIEAAGKAPVWFQSHGVPRFAPFSPDIMSDIYADEAALVEIACQSCGAAFHVGFSSSVNSRVKDAMTGTNDREVVKKRMADWRLDASIKSYTLDYGDPPNTGCCPAGPTMNSKPVRVLEYWSRHDKKHVEDGTVKNVEAYQTWTRNPDLEIELPGL